MKKLILLLLFLAITISMSYGAAQTEVGGLPKEDEHVGWCFGRLAIFLGGFQQEGFIYTPAGESMR